MKHTQPPWLVSPYKNVIDSQGCLIAQVELLPGDTGDEQIANAHLIAAAPELLELCEKLLHVADVADGRLDPYDLDMDFGELRKLIDRSAEVIKKARGD